MTTLFYFASLFFNTYIIIMYPTHQSAIYILTNRNSVMKLFKNNFKDWNHICLRKRSLKNAKISHVRSWMITLLLKQKSFVNKLIFHWRKNISLFHFNFRWKYIISKIRDRELIRLIDFSIILSFYYYINKYRFTQKD